MFTDSESFYYCPDGDLTNSVQRLRSDKMAADAGSKMAADDRFFWNKHMMHDIINADVCTSTETVSMYLITLHYITLHYIFDLPAC